MLYLLLDSCDSCSVKLGIVQHTIQVVKNPKRTETPKSSQLQQNYCLKGPYQGYWKTLINRSKYFIATASWAALAIIDVQGWLNVLAPLGWYLYVEWNESNGFIHKIALFDWGNFSLFNEPNLQMNRTDYLFTKMLNIVATLDESIYRGLQREYKSQFSHSIFKM